MLVKMVPELIVLLMFPTDSCDAALYCYRVCYHAPQQGVYAGF